MTKGSVRQNWNTLSPQGIEHNLVAFGQGVPRLHLLPWTDWRSVANMSACSNITLVEECIKLASPTYQINEAVQATLSALLYYLKR